MTIIEIKARPDGGHGLQSQSHRKECWVDGWVEVPAHLESAVYQSGGFCELKMANGVLVGITATERPPEPEMEPTEQERLRADLDYLAALQGVSL